MNLLKGSTVPPLQPDTLKIIQFLFPEEQRKEIIDILTEECAKGIRPNNQEELERIQIAVLKISGGDLDEFQKAIECSQTDWRDLLVSADFADDVQAHKNWFPKKGKK
jgi:hypothetical protein